MALVSGLRANELRSLCVKHLDTERGGIILDALFTESKKDASFTKSRKGGFQPLPSWIVDKLSAMAAEKEPNDTLLQVPLHPHRPFQHDLKRAGIPKWAPGGKLDFHALRTGFTTLVFEAGANPKEAQKLARHATPELTMRIYARARDPRLAELVNTVGDVINPERTAEQRIAVGAEGQEGPVGPSPSQNVHGACTSYTAVARTPMKKGNIPGGIRT